MTTKINPGKFNCYASAMPDEPIFTILGRDPAFPATVLFWREERARQGKNVSDDDVDRLVAALQEAAGAVSWRAQNLDGPDGKPTWQTPMSFVTDDTKPVCVPVDSTPRYLNQDEMLSDMREIVDKFTEGTLFNDYDRACELLGVLRGVVEDMERPVETNTFNEDVPQQAVYTVGLIRTVQGDLTIEEINRRLAEGPVLREKIGTGIRQVCQDLNRKGVTFIPALREWMFAIVDRLGGYATELGVPPLAEPTYDRPVRDRRGYEIPVIGMEFMNEDDLKPGEKLIVDTAPHDLAHNPEVPQHRFAMFNKGEHYAYARGLEINPSHLPTALDALHLDGWELVSLFGQTDSKNVGFIFKRIVPPAVIVDTGPKLEWGGETRQGRWAGKMVDPATMGRSEAMRNWARLDPAILKPIPLAHKKPKIEVHLEGMSDVDALSTMAVIECRLRWLPQDYEQVRIVGLISDEPEAAFDFVQRRGGLDKRKTLIREDGGCTEFGRQLEG